MSDFSKITCKKKIQLQNYYFLNQIPFLNLILNDIFFYKLVTKNFFQMGQELKFKKK